MKGHAVAIEVITPEGIPLVRDPKKQVPLFWKFPGGRSEANEKTAVEVAVREIKQEIGVSLTEDSLELLHTEDRGSHYFSFFRAVLSAMPKLKTQGDEGEEIRIFQASELDNMEDFFPPHKKVLMTIAGANKN